VLSTVKQCTIDRAHSCAQRRALGRRNSERHSPGWLL